MGIPITPEGLAQTIATIRRQAPVVHNITNYVVMNNTANAILAMGASPVMAHAEEEVAEMAGLASALVINIGTLSPAWIRAMFVAAEKAKERRIPLVLDPVGAGATTYRTKTARDLIRAVPPEIIRGNASEILALISDTSGTKGVDSTASFEVALDAAGRLHRETGSVVCVSGAVDYVVSGETVIEIHNGHPLMTRVTGLGCTASALCGVFAAVESDFAAAAAQAMAVMGIAGEQAAGRADGPGTLQVHFLDALYRMGEGDLDPRLRVRA